MRNILLMLMTMVAFHGWAQTSCSSSDYQVSGPVYLCVNESGMYSITGPAGASFIATWNFDDGTTATGTSIVHSYASTGYHNIEVMVRTSGGATCRATRATVVYEPSIRSVVACQGGTTRFTFWNTYGDVSGTINFGDGSSASIDGRSIEHIYENHGRYEISASISVSPEDNSGPIFSKVLTATVNIPECDVFGCENRDFETGDFTRWDVSTVIRPCSGTCEVVTGPRANEHQIVSGSGMDTYGGFPVVAAGGSYSMKLGNNLKSDAYSYHADFRSMTITQENALIAYRLAAVFEDVGEGEVVTSLSKPYINLEVVESEAPEGCSNFRLTKDMAVGFSKVPGQNIYYLPWTTYYFDLSDLIGKTVYIAIDVRKGNYTDANNVPRNLFAYAYLDTYCTSPSIQISGNRCINSPIQFSASFDGTSAGESVRWNMGDGTVLNDGKNVSHSFASPGNYTITMDYNSNFKEFPEGPIRPDYGATDCGILSLSQTITVTECAAPFVCEDCIPSFSPLPGQKYILSAWVKEGDGIGRHTYNNPGIRINFNQGTTFGPFKASGLIIDGWQRIEGEFAVPDNAEEIWVELQNENNTVEVFFDDIRLQPVNSSMKAFVYDPVTLRLVSELDERNYATFFEYDEEGMLTRVKKETERGVKTVRESRESMRKRPSNP